jgi:RHS repeat-associated protein
VASNPATLNNGETRASGGHWTVTSGRTLDIVLAGSRSVSEVVLVGNPGTTDDPLPNEGGTWPADSQFDTSRYTVQTWSGSAWQTVGSVSGNTLHIRRVSFAPVTTDRIRVIPTDDASNGQTPNDNLVSLTEIEVRSPAGAGEIRAQRFDAWGKLEQAAGSVPTYGYTGREPDATGLIHYRARYYHPGIGRFVSRDPLGLSAGINPYAYAEGNPVLFNDPDGLMAALAWNSASSYVSQNGTRILDGTQTVLDVAGLVPGFGELADGANALIYLGRGDNTNAALSGAAMIPFIGWGATTAKVVGRVDNAVDSARGPVIIGETMARVEQAAAKIPGSKILNDMPDFRSMGMNADQVTSSMMQSNRKWILEQMRSGRQIIDIGADANRATPSIFYQMEQNMLKNYQKLHPEFSGAISP